MFGPPSPLLSPFGGTLKRLVFLRNVPAQDPTTREERTNYWPFLDVEADVQPRDMSRVLNTRLAQTYGEMFDIIVADVVDVKTNDRVIIEGAECIVEGANVLGSHTEIVAGARQPPAR
jgi:hypothetical protein